MFWLNRWKYLLHCGIDLIGCLTIAFQGFGFVEFEDYRDADDAVYELNGKDLLGER